jgi:hypothetical protein
MLTKTFRLFKAFGISIGIDLSWFIVRVLITWSLAAGLFPSTYEDLTAACLLRTPG